jgi:hypothetical protein
MLAELWVRVIETTGVVGSAAAKDRRY